MLRKIFYTAVVLFTTLNILFAQEKTWQFGDSNKQEGGKAVLNLPNNAGHIVVATQDNGAVIFKINPNTGIKIWEKLFSNQLLSAICKADNNNCFVAGVDANAKKAVLHKINTTTGAIISTENAEDSTSFTALYPLSNGNALVCGYRENTVGNLIPIVSAVDVNGKLAKIPFPYTYKSAQATAISGKNQNIFVAGAILNNSSVVVDTIFIWKQGSAPILIPSKGTDTNVEFLTVASDNTFYVGYSYSFNFSDKKSIILHLSSTGAVQESSEVFPDASAAIATTDAGLVCTGSSGGKLFIAHLDKTLKVKWAKNIGFAPFNQGIAIDTTSNGYVVVGETGIIDGDMDIIVTTVGQNPILKKQIKGQVKGSTVCGINAVPLSSWSVQGKTLATGKIHYALTDSDGFYTMTVDDAGPIELQSVNIIGSGYKNCSAVNDTVLANGVIKIAPILFVQDTSATPRLRVDISTAVLVPNQVSTYSVYVKNTKSADVQNVYVKLKFDKDLKPVLPLNADSIFIGTLKANADTTFKVSRRLDILQLSPNKTYCAEVRVFPNNSSWGGPRIQVTTESCTADTLRFNIKNITPNVGAKATLTNKNYIVIIDDVVMRVGNIPSLNPGQSILVTIAKITGNNDFKTFIIAVDQGGDNPFGSFASTRGENCSGSSNFIAQTTYSDYDDDKTYSLECLKAVGTPPNKSETIVFPLGSTQNYITQDSITLEFHHIIVNNGNEVSKNIVMEVTPSNKLNLSQIELGAASHAYKVSVENGKLIFSFNNMELTPTSVDAQKAIGFFNYRLKVPVADTINNTGQKFTTQTIIKLGYFNAPIFVDTISRIIKKLKSVSIKSVHKDLPSISVAPNPMQNSAQISVAEEWIGATFSLFDLQGRLVHQMPITQSTFQLYADDLQQGIFLCRIELKGKLVANGKIVVQ